MYDVNKNTAPVNISKLFSRISSVHTYNTRASTSEHFYTKESRLNVKRNAFSRVGVKKERDGKEEGLTVSISFNITSAKSILLDFIK